MGATANSALPFAYNDFHGGLNTLNAPYLLTDNESRDLSNVQGTTAGAIVKRNGLTTFASPAAAQTSLFALESTSPPFLISAGGTVINSISTGGTVTNIKTAVTNNVPWSFISGPAISGQGPLYGMNGTDTPQQWTGSGLTGNWTATDAGGTVPNGTMCLYWTNQVFVSGVSSTPSRLYWSAIADPTGWNPANLKGAGFMDFDPNDGQAITGIGVVGPYILIGKPRKLWVLISPATATARMISNNVGIAAYRSVAAGPEGTFFLSEDRGVYLTNGTKISPISDKLLPTFNSVQPTARNNAVGVEFNGHYYLSVPISSGSTNDTVLDYDSLLGSWWKHSIGSNQFALWHPTAGSVGLYSAKSTSAIVDQCFVPGVFVDNGTPFTWVWRGPWQSPTFYRRRRFPTPWFRKNLRQVRIEGSGTVDFSIAKDFAGLESLVQANCLAVPGGGTFGGADGTTFGGLDGSLFGAPSVQRFRSFSRGYANAFSMVFSATSSTPDTVLEYTMMLTDRKDLVVT